MLTLCGLALNQMTLFYKSPFQAVIHKRCFSFAFNEKIRTVFYKGI